MGSLSSRPNVPSLPQTIITQTASQTAAAPAVPTQSAEEAFSDIRKQSLLGRERSRFGTIETGFRGLLGLSESASPRKTLLGE